MDALESTQRRAARRWPPARPMGTVWPRALSYGLSHTAQPFSGRGAPAAANRLCSASGTPPLSFDLFPFAFFSLEFLLSDKGRYSLIGMSFGLP